MIRSLRQWFRRVYPPLWVIVLVLFVYGVIELAVFWLEDLQVVQAAEQLRRTRDFAVLGFCYSYASYRATRFHPRYDKDYRDWLERSPWSSDKPLPFGPIHLVLQDVLTVSVLWSMMHGSELQSWAPIVFLFFYLTSLCGSFWITEAEVMCYVLAFGLGFVPLVWPDRLPMLVVLLLLYPFAYLGLRLALRRFPWPAVEWWESLRAQMKNEREKLTKNSLGWPFDRLFPDTQRTASISQRDAALLPLLVAWWTFALLSTRLPGWTAFLFLVYTIMMMVCVFGRLGVYCTYFHPPIDFWGRIFTGRWIIPGYDKVFVAPLLALVVGISIPIVGFNAGIREMYYLPIAMGMVLFISLISGPTLSDWSLTGRHRIVPGFANRKVDYVEL